MWIEISVDNLIDKVNVCHSLYESVNWNFTLIYNIDKNNCHSLYESVNWNIKQTNTCFYIISHSLYESVNWNSINNQIANRGYMVTLFTRVWIEIE